MKQTESHREDVALGDERTDKPIRFKAVKDIYWEDWGHMRLVFRKGQVYDGVQHTNGRVSGYNAYFDVSDYVYPEEIEIIN